MAVFVALAAVAVGIGALAGSVTPSPEPGPGAGASSTTASQPETLTVHVSGMVVSPGVVEVPAGAIVADAIAAAGGLTSDARVDHLNLAALLSSGEHIVVPGPDVVETPTPGDADQTGPISLSDADAAELEALPGVGPVLAERIVAHREANGPFTAVEDLLEVPGIGEAKLAALRDLVQP